MELQFEAEDVPEADRAYFRAWAERLIAEHAPAELAGPLDDYLFRVRVEVPGPQGEWWSNDGVVIDIDARRADAEPYCSDCADPGCGSAHYEWTEICYHSEKLQMAKPASDPWPTPEEKERARRDGIKLARGLTDALKEATLAAAGGAGR